MVPEVIGESVAPPPAPQNGLCVQILQYRYTDSLVSCLLLMEKTVVRDSTLPSAIPGTIFECILIATREKFGFVLPTSTRVPSTSSLKFSPPSWYCDTKGHNKFGIKFCHGTN